MRKNKLLLSTILMFSTLSAVSCNKGTPTSEVVSCTITFDLNGGTMSADKTKVVNANEAVGSLPTPTKDNSIFLGWYTTNDSSGEQITSKSVIDSNITLYAKYKEDDVSIVVDYDRSVTVNDLSTIYVTLDSSIADKGVTFTLNIEGNLAVKVSETSTSLTFKALSGGDLNVNIKSVANPKLYKDITIKLISRPTLQTTMKNLNTLTNYTFTGFTASSGTEEVQSILTATDGAIIQTNANGQAFYNGNDSTYRFGIAVNTNKDAYYIDSKTSENTQVFQDKPTKVLTDIGFLTNTNFQGVSSSSLNDSGDIYGFKAINSDWFASLNGDEHNMYAINGNNSNPELAMAECAFLKMTAPEVYMSLRKLYLDTEAPYNIMATNFTTKVSVVSSSSIFVEITYASTTYYGRLSKVGSTIQGAAFSKYYQNNLSVTPNTPTLDSSLSNIKNMTSLGGIMSKDVYLNKTNGEYNRFTVNTYINQYYIMKYYSNDYIKYEKENTLTNYNYIKNNQESYVGIVKPTNSTALYEFALKYYRNGLEEAPVSRDKDALSYASSYSMTGTLSDNYDLLSSSKVFYRTNLLYTFKSHQSIEGSDYLVSYNDDVYNQFATFNTKVSALRHVTAIKVNMDTSAAGSTFKNMQVQIGHLSDGSNITWDESFTYSELGAGYISSASVVASDLTNANAIDTALRSHSV